MATVTKPIALDESFNTTEVTPRNIADVLADELSRITGRNASQVEYDNTESGLTADNVQDALDEIVEDIPTVPTVDIQTAVDEFETYNGGLLSECKVALSPIQDLHGYDSPWVGGAGKNKYPLEDKTINGLTFTSDVLMGKVTRVGTATATGWGSGIISTINLPVGTYIVSATNNPSNAQLLNGYTPLGVVTSNGLSFTVTDSSANYRVAWNTTSGVTYNDVIEGLMIRSASESDPTFEPYSNICPISGHTQAKVGDDGKNRFNPNDLILGKYFNSDGTLGEYAGWNCVYINVEPNTTYTISGLSPNGGTYFCYFDKSKNFISNGGTHRNATLTTPNGCYLLGIEVLANGTEDNVQVEKGSSATAYVPYNGYQVTVNLGGTYYSGTLDVVSGELTVDSAFIASYNGESLPSTWISDRDVYAVGITPTTGAEVCYELATPQTIQLSPTMVKALVGENHLSAPLEGQEITESKYKQMFTFDDVIAYIQSLS